MEEGGRLLERALTLGMPSRLRMIETAKALESFGKTGDAGEWRRMADEEWTPGCALDADFGNGIRLAGISLGRQAPGAREIGITYFWDIHRTADVGKWPSVFVHFMEGSGFAFQDDHELCDVSGLSIDWRSDRLFAERRHVRIPDGVKPGAYRVRLGLVGAEGKRIAPRTNLPVKRNAVTLPVKVVVRPSPEPGA